MGVLAALGLALSACTGPAPADPATAATTPTVTASDSAAPSSSVPSPSAPVVERVEQVAWAPAAGEAVAVVGVAAGDELNVRGGPGVSNATVATLQPLGTAVATGRSRMVGTSAWVEVTTDGEVTGWVNQIYVARLSDEVDVTADLGGLPTAAATDDLGVQVAHQYWHRVPEGWYDVVIADEPEDGTSVTIDLVGFGDDSVLGVRLRIGAELTGEVFTATTVHATYLCTRGVIDGRCI